MRHDLAIILDDLVVAAQAKRLEHADRRRPLEPLRDGRLLGGLDAAAEEADGLVVEPHDGPAATLFAFGRRAHLFPGGQRSMTFLLTAAQARRLGYRVVIGDEELDLLLRRLLGETPLGFGDVRAWLACRLVRRSEEEDERLELRRAV